MKLTTPILAAALTLSCLGTSACGANSETIAAHQEVVDCASSSDVLDAIEHKDAEAIDKAVSLLSCYKGGEASSMDVALGNMLASHPKTILSAMHAHHLSTAQISHIAANQPWHLVDHFCGLLEELDDRASALARVAQYDRERRIASDAIHDFRSEVAPHCSNPPDRQH